MYTALVGKNVFILHFLTFRDTSKYSKFPMFFTFQVKLYRADSCEIMTNDNERRTMKKTTKLWFPSVSKWQNIRTF